MNKCLRIFIGKYFYSTFKYIPMISFNNTSVTVLAPTGTGTEGTGPEVSSNSITGTKDTGTVGASTVTEGKRSKDIVILDDYYKSPYKLWYRNIKDDEINIINHGIND
ncbi:uncharacterized protein TA03915 [Theileria annulata]|uniref:Uncharacterized protein n=1 Tax=Theileria annulata TaxID=5874 RepID=Q4UCC1_THEAN|nr:uncharacterized protein TA03915 [Theileria annulata]CAI75530.1 hypothetical protein TA03915 [Theileria annulata]|eukprot:XP_955006.1 hypothetical protein TA03915 [Theileria annulata]